MKKISIIVLVFISASIYGQKELEQHPMAKSLECNYCHSCEIPTKDDPCLYNCPRTHMVTLQHPVEDAPEVLVLDELIDQSDLYAPVVFSHRLHAEMSNMAGGCQLCHHYNPPGIILGCQECHENSRSRTDLTKPDLKGAYHRQCIDCHREWTHEVECASCHLLNEKIVADEVQVKDYSEIKHPKIIEPTKIVYNTEFDDGDIVTFYHDEHVNLFNLDCSSCHSNSSCASCHDTTPMKLEPSLDQLHSVCSECHDTEDNCTNCHIKKERPRFNHTLITGFDLNKYHKNIDCKSCHGKDGFKGLNDNCGTCHTNWSPDNFDHKITGLILSESHEGNDCEVCHENNNFKKPTCSMCHDEDVTYPDFMPGDEI